MSLPLLRQAMGSSSLQRLPFLLNRNQTTYLPLGCLSTLSPPLIVRFREWWGKRNNLSVQGTFCFPQNSFLLISTVPYSMFFQFVQWAQKITKIISFHDMFHEPLQDATPNCSICWRFRADFCRGDWIQDRRHVGFVNPRSDLWTADWELLQRVFTKLWKWGIVDKQLMKSQLVD